MLSMKRKMGSADRCHWDIDLIPSFDNSLTMAGLPCFPIHSLRISPLEKTIGSNERDASRFLEKENAWISLNHGIMILRKADASLDPDLLQKWCQVVARGKLDEGGRYTKFDEGEWEKHREELLIQLRYALATTESSVPQ